MPILPSARSALKRFTSNEDGSIAVEAVIILPVLFWTFLALFATFHSYRTYSINQKAAYTISDMISRETNPIDDSYLDGAKSLFRYLTNASNTDVSLRVTAVTYDAGEDKYLRQWSEAKGGALGAATDGEVSGWRNRLPVMPDGDVVVVVETHHAYDPPFNTGMVDREVENFVFTRPRYAPQVCWSSCDDGSSGSSSSF